MLKRRRKPRMGTREPDGGRVRCQAHLQWVRGFPCAVEGPDCWGKIEAAHVRTGTDGGLGIKPSDRYALPLCEGHHRVQHQMGEQAFERNYEVNMRAVADDLWKQSMHRLKWERVKETT